MPAAARDADASRRQCPRRRVRRLDHGTGRHRRLAAGDAPRQRPRRHHRGQFLRVQAAASSSATCCRFTPTSSRSARPRSPSTSKSMRSATACKWEVVKVTEATLTYVATGEDRKPRPLPPESEVARSERRRDGSPAPPVPAARSPPCCNRRGCRGSGVARCRQRASPAATGTRSASASPPARPCPTPSCCGPASCPTRATPEAPAPWPCTVRWEVADDEAFRRIVASGSASALPELAHSVHVDVTGLRPDRWYWYRFMLGDAVSPVARTRTAPARDAMPAPHAARRTRPASTGNSGSYAAHRHIAAAAPDLVAFLGDYIYEWGAVRRCASASGAARQRVADAGGLPRPLCAVQDRPAPAGRAPRRAVDRHLGRPRSGERLRERPRRARSTRLSCCAGRRPTRRSTSTCRSGCRRCRGRLTRICASTSATTGAGWRASTCSTTASTARTRPARAAGRGGSTSVDGACSDRLQPAAHAAGREQEAWLAQGWTASPARWNILAQQTLMAQCSQAPVATDGGRFWTDGWDGYPAARDAPARHAGASAARPIRWCMSGDVHSFFASDLQRDFNRARVRRQPGAGDRILRHLGHVQVRGRSRAPISTWR